MDDFSELVDAEVAAMGGGVVDMTIRFLFNLVLVFGVSRWLYYPKGRRRDYLFVFCIISISIFLMVYLLSSLKLKIGFALGLFAIFGIIRYRTEQMPVREMSYLFVIISMSVINALSQSITLGQLLISNGLLILAVWISEQEIGLKNVRSRLIVYDDVSKILPEKEAELIEDIKQRTGLNVTAVEVGHVDFTRDMVMVRVYYEADGKSPKNADIENMTKLPREL